MEAFVRGTAFDVRVFPDPDALSRAAAEVLCSLVTAPGPGENFTIALSGGSTPRRLYSLLGSSPYRQTIPWQRVHFFWADERCVPPDHRESNYRMAKEMFLSRISPPEQNLHRIPGEAGALAAAALYEKELVRFFPGNREPRFDMILLGAGTDGHTASLFPGFPGVQEKKRLAVPVHLDAPGPDRVTLTLPVLNNASHVVFLATGAEKAGIVSEIVEHGNRKGYPAGMIQPIHGTLTWMIDQKAGSALAPSGG